MPSGNEEFNDAAAIPVKEGDPRLAEFAPGISSDIAVEFPP